MTGEDVRWHPILFNGQMVRAILAGVKTQTRRVGGRYDKWEAGDWIWVRETFTVEEDGKYRYRADEPQRWDADAPPIERLRYFEQFGFRWKPSIHMPRKASRISLEIVAIRKEHIQDMSVADMVAEGIWNHPALYLIRDDFRRLWDSINTKRGYGWDTNPEVTVIEFRLLEDG